MGGCVLERGLRARRSSIQKADHVCVDLQTRYDGSLLTFVPSFGRKYDTEDQRRRMQMGQCRWTVILVEVKPWREKFQLSLGRGHGHAASASGAWDSQLPLAEALSFRRELKRQNCGEAGVRHVQDEGLSRRWEHVRGNADGAEDSYYYLLAQSPIDWFPIDHAHTHTHRDLGLAIIALGTVQQPQKPKAE